MEVLLQILLKLTGFFCWLCTKRENAQLRLDAERLIAARRQEKRGR